MRVSAWTGQQITAPSDRRAQFQVVLVVLDDFNTHRTASLYEAFPPGEVRLIAKRLEFHDTPKHGGWLNMAEIEIKRSWGGESFVGASLMKRPSDSKSRPWSVSATSTGLPIGASLLTMPESNSTISILPTIMLTEY